MSLSTDTEEEGTASKLSLAAEREESVAHHQTERAASQVASCVSMKSDHSMVDPSCSSGESPSNPEENTQRAASPVSSCVSMKSDISMKIPPDFSDEKPFNPREKTQRAASPVPSCVSMKSDISMKISPDLSDEKPSFNPRENTQRTSSPVPSCVSMKSDISMKIPPDLSDEKPSFNPIRETTQIAASEVPSCVSMKSDISMKIPLDFSVEKPPRFVNGYLTEQSCKIMATALQAANSPLRELDLHNNEVQDSGMKLLLTGLMSPECNLEIFGLACCKLSDQSCEAMASALQSETLPLRELDLSNNNLQDSGVNLISAGLVNNPNCKLEILRLAMCNLTHESCEVFASGLQSESLPLRELDLSNNDLQDSGVNLISAGLKNPHCKLELLRLSGCLVTVDGCSYLASALISNPSHLIELDLSYNHPGDTGVKLLSARLQDPHCKLKRLNVDHDEEFRITPGIRKYTCELTLDPNTAHMELSLSEGDRQVTHVKEKQSYPDHPERFEQWRQVISRESLSGRYYWEAELSGFRADIAVTYKGIIRKGEGNNCVFGYNDKSWNLNCFKNNYCAWHDNNYTDIPAPISLTKRVGVYLDWLAGTLSFYSISPDTRTLTHLHTFYSPFTEPLYAGFGVSSSWVRLCPRTDVFN